MKKEYRTMISHKVSFAVVALAALTGIANAQAPGGVKSPAVWFTTMFTDSLNGTYHWQDLAGNDTLFLNGKKGVEATAQRGRLNTYNFNPAMPFDSTVSQEFVVKGSALDQKTVIGVVGAKKKEADKDAYIYRIRGNNSRLLSKTKVFHIGADGPSSYTYSPDLKSSGDTAKRVKIVSYLEALKPDHSIWGRSRWATVSFGGPFSQSAGGDTASVGETLPSGNFYAPELVVFPRFLQKDERLRVETYLALKYGITLENDYLSPSGVKLWGGSDWMNRVTGFGRDVRSGFDQYSSTTVYEENAYDVDDTYHLGNSNNKSSAYNLLVMGFMDDTSLPDSCYVLFADNGRETSILTDQNTPDSIYTSDSLKLMQRHWQLRTIGLDSTFAYQVELGYNMTHDSLFALYRNKNVFLAVNQKGEDKFDNPDDLLVVRMDTTDEERQKIIFQNVYFKPECYFTFGFSGIPMEKPAQEKYEYYLELTDPTCDGMNNVNDGRVKLLLPEKEGGFYYSFKVANHGGLTYDVAEDSIVIDNAGHEAYTLTLLPVQSNTIEFEGDGVTFVNVNFINNNGSAEWIVGDPQNESKVAFVNNSAWQASESQLLYGVRIADGKIYKIENGNISASSDHSVSAGDKMRIDRTSQTEVKVMKNDIVLFTMPVPVSSTFKLGVKSQGGNVEHMKMEHFEWGAGEFPYFFFDQYSSAMIFNYEHPSSQHAGPTGYMQYLVDFSAQCYQSNPYNGDNKLEIITDLENREFTAVYTSAELCDVTFSVYDDKGVLYARERVGQPTHTVTKRFTMAKPGVYHMTVEACGSIVNTGSTVLK